MSATLYERLGGTDGITQIAHDLVDIHLNNPAINARYKNSDPAHLVNGAATFFIAGTGGPNIYEGKDMLATHKGMNISPAEFMAVLDDALEALEKNNIGQAEQQEVLFTLYSMRKDIVGV